MIAILGDSWMRSSHIIIILFYVFFLPATVVGYGICNIDPTKPGPGRLVHVGQSACIKRPEQYVVMQDTYLITKFVIFCEIVKINKQTTKED